MLKLKFDYPSICITYVTIFVNSDSRSLHMTIAMSIDTIVPHDLAIRLLDVRHARRNSSLRNSVTYQNLLMRFWRSQNSLGYNCWIWPLFDLVVRCESK